MDDMSNAAVLQGAVTRDSQLMSGEPVFSGTRVPIWVLFDHLRHGHPLDEFFVAYPGVRPEQVQVVLNGALDSLLKATEEGA